MPVVQGSVYAAELPARLTEVLLGTPAIADCDDDAKVLAHAIAKLPPLIIAEMAFRMQKACNTLLQVAHRNVVLFALLPPTSESYDRVAPVMIDACSALVKPLHLPAADNEKFRIARSAACVALGMDPIANVAAGAAAINVAMDPSAGAALGEVALEMIGAATDVAFIASDSGILEGLGELLGAIVSGIGDALS